VKKHFPWRIGLVVALLLMLPGCGGGGNNPSPGTSAGVTATVAAYFEALRRTDPAGIRAVLAPDYNYDGWNAEQASHAFDALLGLTYSALDYRIEALTVHGSTATASVLTVFQGNINLEPIGRSRPPVNGSGRFELELQPRGDVWKLTAVRPFRLSFVVPSTVATRLYDYTVNGQTSLQVAPGASLRLAGKADLSFFILTFIGAASAGPVALHADLDEPWALTLPAPAMPGRFLAHALSFAFQSDPQTREVLYLHGDWITIPVTVVAPS